MTLQPILPLVSPKVPPLFPPLLLSSSKGFELERWITAGASSVLDSGLHWGGYGLVRTHARDLPPQPSKAPSALKSQGGFQGGNPVELAGSDSNFSRSESWRFAKEKIR